MLGSMSFIQLRSGGIVDFCDIKLHGPVLFGDMVWALSQINRFTGHTKRPYSVLQHSVEVAKYLRRQGATLDRQLSGLFHDFHEALIGDVSSPLKRMLPDYKLLEDTIEKKVHEFLIEMIGPFDPHWVYATGTSVADADKILVATEGRDLLDADLERWRLPFDPMDARIIPVSPVAARRQFWRRLKMILKDMDRHEIISQISVIQEESERGRP